MANHNHTEEKNAVDNLNEHLTSAGRIIEEKKKIIFWIAGAVLLVAVLAVGYLFLLKQPKDQKSIEAYGKVEFEAANDTVAAEMYKKVADSHGGIGGNLAALEAGEKYYAIGKYQEAAKYLEKFDTDDQVLKANALVLTGDCYVNMKKYDKAIEYFNDAMAVDKGNPQITPRVLLKLANIYDEQKKYDDALAAYEQIKNDYPEFQYGIGIDAYIAREKTRLGK